MAKDRVPQAAGRFIALRNYVAIEVDPGEVQKTLDDALARCQSPACEILESSLARDSREAPPRATMRLRIVPQAAAPFVDAIARGGVVIERRTQSEDKTDQVVDVQARLKNTIELRDRLRKLLANPRAAVKDLVEIETQLARVQAELDSAEGLRQALANETEKIAVTIDIRSRREIGGPGVLYPIRNAVEGVGQTLASSIAAVITFVVAALPWLVLVAPAIYFWRRWRARRGPQTKPGASPDAT